METNTKTENQSATIFTANPLIRKLSKISESSENHVTRKGVSNKCIYYAITIGIGVALAFLMQAIGPAVNLSNIVINESFEINVAALTVAGMTGLIIAFFVFLITPFLAFLIRKSIPVTGALYCASTGYIYAYLALLLDEYKNAVILAVLVTIVVCISMFLLYRTGIIKVTQKFRAVMVTLLVASVIISLITLVCCFIPVPALRAIPDMFYGNGVLGIVFSVIGVLIAAMFLLSDFAVVDNAIETQLPKEYEWYCAYSLAFSVIWLFLKILDLVIKILGKSSSSH